MYGQVLARMPFACSVEQAAASYLIAATDPRLEGIGGKFITDGKERRSSNESDDETESVASPDASGPGVVLMSRARRDRVPTLCVT